MAECLGEFDAPSPMPTRYCSRISLEEYEKSSGQHTEVGLQQLMQHLQYNPSVYYDILAKRKRDEIDNSGFLSYLKIRLTEWYTGSIETMDPEEARKQLDGLKDNIVKSFNYSQEAKGSTRRFSSRIAERKWRNVNKVSFPRKDIEEVSCECPQEKKLKRSVPLELSTQKQSATCKFPLPPSNRSTVPPVPPPPPPPPANDAPVVKPCNSERKENKDTSKEPKSSEIVSSKKILSQKKKLKKVARVNKSATSEGGGFTKLMDQIKNPDTKETLKQISNNKRTGGTWVTPPRKTYSASNDYSNMFNVELLRKFQNAKSPVGFGDSPSLNDVTFTP